MRKYEFVWWNLWIESHGLPCIVEDGKNMEHAGWKLIRYHVASSRWVGKPHINEKGDLVTSFRDKVILSSDEIDALIMAKMLKK